MFFHTILQCSGGVSPGEGGMPLHDSFGVDCKKGATTDIKAQVLSGVWAKG